MERKIYQFTILEVPQGLEISHKIRKDGEIIYVQVHIESKEKRIFPPVSCRVTVPSIEVHEVWNPKIHLMKALNLDWFQYLKKTNCFTGAPVQCLIGKEDQNCAALGISDTLNTFEFQVIPVEETGEYEFKIDMFTESLDKLAKYDMTLRLDLRAVPYYKALDDMAVWWETEESNIPAQVPQAAKEPMYSTWYSYHQMIGEEELLEQCRLSKEYGCQSILLDDGWQTDDKSRGYAYCGDWRPALSKMPDMAGFVKKVHALGMKVIPWYSLPFIGEKSDNFAKFQDMLIDPHSKRAWHVLDPRYPEVREFIISLFEDALNEWDVDGFKMDFIDEFVVTPFSGKEKDGRRDYESFHEAADYMMKECIGRLKAKKPDILLEFRQTYHGPRMRNYGNIFRAVDCPLDAVENHVRVTDIRLLCRESAVHSDMIMWHAEDTAESAALQIINILFSVPQISMRLDELSEEHRQMLKFYCTLWKEYQDAFVNGTFEPLNPISRYPVVKGSSGSKFACTWHSAEVIQMDRLYEDMVFVNGTASGKLYLENHADGKEYQMTVHNCKGELVQSDRVSIDRGLTVYDVPGSGAVQFKR